MKEQTSGKIRIAFVSPNAWTMYNFRRELLQSLLEKGFEVIIIAEKDKYSALIVAMGCLFIPVTIRNRSLSPTDDISLFLSLKKTYKKYKPDFIFHYVVKPNIYGTLAAKMLGIPSIAIITGLGHAFNKNNLLRLLIKKLYQLTLRYAYEVWCLNADDAAYFVDHTIVHPQKVRILPGEGINIEYFKNESIGDHQPFTFLMSARLLKSKGIIEFADASLLLQKMKFNFRSILLGANENHPDAISPAQVFKWQKEHVLIYEGFTDDVRQYLARADCFVYPSYYNEGIPRSLLEACSMQLPVITTDNTGCRDLIIDGFNGFLCNKRDPGNLAVKMEAMLKLDAIQRATMGKNGRNIVEAKYSMSRIVTVYLTTIMDYFNDRVVKN